jgi:hypothetical protein
MPEDWAAMVRPEDVVEIIARVEEKRPIRIPRLDES